MSFKSWSSAQDAGAKDNSIDKSKEKPAQEKTSPKADTPTEKIGPEPKA